MKIRKRHLVKSFVNHEKPTSINDIKDPKTYATQLSFGLMKQIAMQQTQIEDLKKEITILKGGN